MLFFTLFCLSLDLLRPVTATILPLSISQAPITNIQDKIFVIFIKINNFFKIKPGFRNLLFR